MSIRPRSVPPASPPVCPPAGIFAAALGLAVLAAGCRESIHDLADRRVREQILETNDKREAIPFLEGGGRLFDIDASSHVDQEIVLPLLKHLIEIAPTDQWAVLSPKKKSQAFGIVVKLPKDVPTVDRMAQAVQEADDKFPGLILQQWGRDWLLLDLIDQETYENLKKVDPEIDQQR